MNKKLHDLDYEEIKKVVDKNSQLKDELIELQRANNEAYMFDDVFYNQFNAFNWKQDGFSIYSIHNCSGLKQWKDYEESNFEYIYEDTLNDNGVEKKVVDVINYIYDLDNKRFCFYEFEKQYEMISERIDDLCEKVVGYLNKRLDNDLDYDNEYTYDFIDDERFNDVYVDDELNAYRHIDYIQQLN